MSDEPPILLDELDVIVSGDWTVFNGDADGERIASDAAIDLRLSR